MSLASAGVAYKVVLSRILKDLDNICSREVLGKNIKWFAET